MSDVGVYTNKLRNDINNLEKEILKKSVEKKVKIGDKIFVYCSCGNLITIYKEESLKDLNL